MEVKWCKFYVKKHTWGKRFCPAWGEKGTKCDQRNHFMNSEVCDYKNQSNNLVVIPNENQADGYVDRIKESSDFFIYG